MPEVTQHEEFTVTNKIEIKTIGYMFSNFFDFQNGAHTNGNR